MILLGAVLTAGCSSSKGNDDNTTLLFMAALMLNSSDGDVSLTIDGTRLRGASVTSCDIDNSSNRGVRITLAGGSDFILIRPVPQGASFTFTQGSGDLNLNLSGFDHIVDNDHCLLARSQLDANTYAASLADPVAACRVQNHTIDVLKFKCKPD